MKKLLGTLTAIAVLSAGIQTASAHGGWSTTGKVLTGVAGGLLIAKALEPVPTYRVETTYVAPAPAPVYVQYAPTVANAPIVPAAPVYQPAPQPAPVVVYQQQPVYYQPAPVYVAPAPVYYYPRYYAPVPVISFGFGFGGGHYRGYHHR
jgi:hypothetical protein